MKGDTLTRLATAVRNLVCVIALTAWLVHPAKGATSCSVTEDCLNESQSSVCVNTQCVPCNQDPGQCDNYGDLEDPFCEYDSGICWEC
jgi:hypothetical protein